MVAFPRRAERVLAALVLVCWSTVGCEIQGGGAGPSGTPFALGELVKTDTDSTLELFIREQRRHLSNLTRKLYLRNPRELHKIPGMTIERRVQQLFRDDYTPSDLARLSGVDRLRRALEPQYEDDRVLAFTCGLRTMIDDSFDGKKALYIPDQLDAQKLYDCARNLELAAWKITHDRGGDGDVLLLTNSIADDAPMNLSYERLFGQLIALQDMTARIVADRSNRTIRFVAQTLVFLPI